MPSPSPISQRRGTSRPSALSKSRLRWILVIVVPAVGLLLLLAICLVSLLQDSANIPSALLLQDGASELKQDFTPIGRRRTKAHICYSRVHAQIGRHILTNPEYGFNYTVVNAETNISDWDIMYGGYPHCAKGRRHHGNSWGWDWEMKYGLNEALNDRGWDSLLPHQVYHPCMGCKFSYCNKRDMCRIIRDSVDPDLCYVLPDDLDRLKAKMDGKQAWVMKEDATNVHIHTGRGVKYMTKPEQLPAADSLAKGIFMVQPWVEPFLGPGMYRRKAELRFYVAITEVYPLRAYIHSENFVVMAAKPYTTTMNALDDKCMHDTHSGSHQCDKYVSKEFTDAIKDSLVQNRAIMFDDYAKRVEISASRAEQIIRDAHEIISSVVKAGHYALEDHPINKGIDKSGAMCFSIMRIDMGIRDDLKPLIYEISEFPGLYGIGGSVEEGLRGKEVVEDLFRMIGLDEVPMPRDQRSQYEQQHMGGWLPLL